jgi:hypothetical protein
MKFFDNKLAPIIPIQLKLVAGAVFLFGVFYFLRLTVFSVALGLPVALTGAILLFASERLCLDVENWRYKKYVSFLGLSFGKWKSLDQYQKLTLTLFKQSFSNNLPAGGAQNISQSVSVNLNLKTDNRNMLIIANGKYKQIVSLSCEISKAMLLEVVDFTSGSPVLLVENPERMSK